MGKSPNRAIGTGFTHLLEGALVFSAKDGLFEEICSAKIRRLGEKTGQSWQQHVHPQDATKAAHVRSYGELH